MQGLRILSTGVQTLVEDGGRRGYAHLGVPRAGAFDTRAWRLANRLVGNDPGAAVLESLGGGLTVESLGHVTIAVTGAIGEVHVDARTTTTNMPIHLAPGSRVQLGSPGVGIRYYLALSGGLRVRPALGSRSHDTLGGIGPPAIHEGQILMSGAERTGPPLVDHVAPVEPAATFEVLPGPDAYDSTLSDLLAGTWDLDPQSDRIGIRLRGSPLLISHYSLPSKPMVLGAVQLPPNGLPIILGPDHPTTGGYPVIAVVTAYSMCDVAQWPGGPRRFRRA